MLYKREHLRSPCFFLRPTRHETWMFVGSGIEMVPGPGEGEGGNRGGARVRMRDFGTAREAAKEQVHRCMSARVD